MEWTDVAVRRATPLDAEGLGELRVALALEDGAGFDAAHYRRRCHAFFERAVAAEDVVAWLACDDRSAVGMAVLELRPTLPRARSKSHPTVDARVRSVYIVPQFRRRGIATRLMRAAIEEAVRRRIDRLTLGASEMGLPLYEGLGFVLRAREMIYGIDPDRH